MRRPLLKGCLTILVLVALFIAWIAGARSLALLVDRVHTVPIDSQPVIELGIEQIDSQRLRINGEWMELQGPDDRPASIEMKIDPAHHLIVQTGDRTISFGQVDSLGKVVRSAPGERAHFQTDRGLSWPTPLAINFMSGNSPSWKRHLYYRLLWEKPDSSRFEMVWRYEQYYYDRWASGFMVRPGTTGLIRVDMGP
jgi:hypothetical protein